MENHQLTTVKSGAFEADMQLETESKAGNSAASGTPSKAKEDVEMLKKRLKEIEEETESIRAKFESENGMQEESAVPLSLAEKAEIDSRSVYVGNVDYECTVEEVQQHFESCGIINRITILTDSSGNPKGYAYVEFAEVEAAQNALGLNESELHGRQLKVLPKRTNVPGMRQPRGRRFPRGPFFPDPAFYPSYGYGKFQGYWPPSRYSPY